MHQRLSQPEDQLDPRHSRNAAKLWEQAEGATGFERERLIRAAREAETASHLSDWLNSANLRPPT